MPLCSFYLHGQNMSSRSVLTRPYWEVCKETLCTSFSSSLKIGHLVSSKKLQKENHGRVSVCEWDITPPISFVQEVKLMNTWKKIDGRGFSLWVAFDHCEAERDSEAFIQWFIKAGAMNVPPPHLKYRMVTPKGEECTVSTSLCNLASAGLLASQQWRERSRAFSAASQYKGFLCYFQLCFKYLMTISKPWQWQIPLLCSRLCTTAHCGQAAWGEDAGVCVGISQTFPSQAGLLILSAVFSLAFPSPLKPTPLQPPGCFRSREREPAPENSSLPSHSVPR